jgi:hypothetical protein
MIARVVDAIKVALDLQKQPMVTQLNGRATAFWPPIQRCLRAFGVGFILFTQLGATFAGDLIIVGRLGDYNTIISLHNYEGEKGEATWMSSKCRSGTGAEAVSPDDLNGWNDWYAGLVDWKRNDAKIQLSDSGEQLSDSGELEFANDAHDLVHWSGKNLRLRYKGQFEGESPTQTNVLIGFENRCGSDFESPGGVVALIKPGLKTVAEALFRKQGWEIHTGNPIIDIPHADNAVGIRVPVGSEQKAILELKRSGIVFDAGPSFGELGGPGFGWVLVPQDQLSGSSVSEVQKKLQTLLHEVWPGARSIINAVPREGNVFDVTLRGPLSNFVDRPQLPGFWIDTRLELLVDSVRAGDRLLLGFREAELIRWPEAGKGPPPEGFGNKLQCEGDDATKNMSSVISIADKLLTKTLELHDGIGYRSLNC